MNSVLVLMTTGALVAIVAILMSFAVEAGMRWLERKAGTK